MRRKTIALLLALIMCPALLQEEWNNGFFEGEGGTMPILTTIERL